MKSNCYMNVTVGDWVSGLVTRDLPDSVVFGKFTRLGLAGTALLTTRESREVWVWADTLEWVKEPPVPVVLAPLDFKRPVQTPDGRPVRILCTDGPNKTYPIIGIVEGVNFAYYWTKEGQPHSSSQRLVQAPRSAKRFLYLYDHKGHVKTLVKEADDWVSTNPSVTLLGKKEITITEGEGMSDCGCHHEGIQGCKCYEKTCGHRV